MRSFRGRKITKNLSKAYEYAIWLSKNSLSQIITYDIKLIVDIFCQ